MRRWDGRVDVKQLADAHHVDCSRDAGVRRRHDEVESLAFSLTTSKVVEQHADHRGVDEAAFGEVNEHASVKTAQGQSDVVGRGHVVLTTDLNERRIAVVTLGGEDDLDCRSGPIQLTVRA